MTKVDREGTVFVLEDDAEVRESLTALLEAMGLRTRAFACGRDIVRSAATLVDGCLLLDIGLPDYDGFEVLRMLREADVDLPAIFMTGDEMNAARAPVRGSGARVVLRKPISDTVLLATLADVLGGEKRAEGACA